MKNVLCALLLLCVGAFTAIAAPPRTINFQGSLRLGSGVPVPNGQHSLTFRMYTQATGGTAIWSETGNVFVAGSVFAAVLGETSPLDMDFDAQYWMGVQVGTEPEMQPRILLTAVPYAMNVADGQVVTSLSGLKDDIALLAGSGISITTSGQGITIGSNGGGGDADWDLGGDDMWSLPVGNVGIGTQVPQTKLHVGGIVRSGRSGTSGEFQALSSEGVAPSTFSGNGNGGGGQLVLRNNDGLIATEIATDPTGAGGVLVVRRNDTQNGVILDGTRGLGSSLYVGGPNPTQIRSDLAGDASVNLPNNAINPFELTAESGVASYVGATVSTFSLSTATSLLAARTIQAPSAGFVVVMASFEVSISNPGTFDVFTTIGLNDQVGSIPAGQDLTFFLPATPGGSFLMVPQANTAVFPVTAGPQSFYLNGRQNGGDCRVSDIQLTCLFVPTAYGSVQSSLVVAAVADDAIDPGGAVTRGPLSAGEVAAEREESRVFYNRAVSAELDAMEVRIARMRQEIENEEGMSGGER